MRRMRIAPRWRPRRASSLLREHEPDDRRDRAEVVDCENFVGGVHAERGLEERDDLEDTGRVDEAALDERKIGRGRGGRITEQEVVYDEARDRLLDDCWRRHRIILAE